MELNKILKIILLALVCTIAGISVYFFAAGKVSFSNKKNAELYQSNETVFVPVKNAFEHIGSIRVSTKPGKNGKSLCILVTPVLQYQADDKPFFEELDSKQKDIKELIYSYFSALTEDQLKQKTEEEIKADLLKKINSILVLQKIQALYFSDFMFF